MGSWMSISDYIYPMGYIDVITAVAGSVFFITFCYGISNINYIFDFLKNVGQHTLLILCVHHLDKYLWRFERHMDFTVIKDDLMRIALVLSVSYMIILLRNMSVKFWRAAVKRGRE